MEVAIKPDVSVVVPCFNDERFIGACIDSVLSQEASLEVIVVNDGSTDGTREILTAIQDPRITILHQENLGISAARNRGAELAKGHFIHFLDSDDIMAPASYSTLLAQAVDQTLDVLYFGGQSFMENDQLRATFGNYEQYYAGHDAPAHVLSGPEYLHHRVERDAYRSSAVMQLIKADFYRDSCTPFIEGRVHEDNFFTYDSMLRAGRVNYLPELLYQRRIRGNSIMTSPRSPAHLLGYAANYIRMLGVNVDGLEDHQRLSAAKVVSRVMTSTNKVWKELTPTLRREAISSAANPAELAILLSLRKANRPAPMVR